MKDIKALSDQVRQTAYDIHVYHGHGHLEKVYENALAHRLRKAGLDVKQQHPIKVYDEDGTLIGDYLADLLVEGVLIVELKTARTLAPEHEAQILGYLKSVRLEHGLLINFGSYKFEIRKFVAQAVRETLLAFHATEFKAPGPGSKVEAVKQTELQPAPALPNFPEKLKPAAMVEPPKPSVQQKPLKTGLVPTKPAASEPQTPSSILNPPFSPETGPPSVISQPPSSSGLPLLSVPLRLVGVIGKLYVVLESDRGLVLLDQHAAHERILFEQMLNRVEQSGSAPSQKLLLPETIELPARDANFLREQLPALTRLGVGLSEFGERTFLLDTLPPFVKAADPRRFVLDLVDELKAAGREVNLARLGEHTIAKTVCRHAVKANDPLGGRELEKLVEDLRHCVMPYTCPHGRPTLIEMNYRELEKKFGRTQ